MVALKMLLPGQDWQQQAVHQLLHQRGGHQDQEGKYLVHHLGSVRSHFQ